MHTAISTTRKVGDVSLVGALALGDEPGAFADADYHGVEQRKENLEVPTIWHIAKRPSKQKALSKNPWGERIEWIEQAKASIQSKFEHPLLVVKNTFRHRKTRY